MTGCAASRTMASRVAILRDAAAAAPQDEVFVFECGSSILTLRCDAKIASHMSPGKFLSQVMSSQKMPAETEFRVTRGEDVAALDARLRDDIRLLGRVLGDTV